MKKQEKEFKKLGVTDYKKINQQKEEISW